MSRDCGLASYFPSLHRDFMPFCRFLQAELWGWTMQGPLVLVHSDERRLEIMVGEVVGVSREPSYEQRDGLADMAARSTDRLSRTGKNPEKIPEWVNNQFPARGRKSPKQ
jgi:hypothetical protein